MKQGLIIVSILALTYGISLGQQTQAPAAAAPKPQQPAPAANEQIPTSASAAAPGQNSAHIAPGSIIPARLTKTVDAKKVKTGDEIIATVPGDLKATNGQIVVPKDTKIIGHVTEAQARKKDQKESQLGIAFNQMTMKDGQQVQLPLSIQAVVAPPSRNAAPSGQEPSSGASPSGAPSTSGGGAPAGGGRNMGGNTSQSQGTSQPPEGAPTNTEASNPNPPITENTRGVVGIPNVTISPAQDSGTGTVLTSEKNNVKLEGGTTLLLRVANGTAQGPANPTTPNPQQ